ncbi:MAG: hypothetical protein V1911_01880 [Candidatus Micrarchaeota archaeon]
MAKKDEEGNVMVWEDKTGKYKLGYSQYVQMKNLKVNTMLLVCVVILIVMIAVGALYANALIQRIDTMNVFSKMGSAAFALLF